MAGALHAIELCKTVLQKPGLSDKALELLKARIKKEEQRHEEARNRCGPRQVYLSQMNEKQVQDFFLDAVAGFKPEQIEKLDEMIRTGKSLAADDIEVGQKIRASRQGKKVDVNSEDERN
jgi:hypothetical protein